MNHHSSAASAKIVTNFPTDSHSDKQNSTRASDSSFYLMFNKRFHHFFGSPFYWQYGGPKKFCQQGHCAGFYSPMSSLNAPKGSSCYPKSIIFQLQIYYQSHWIASCKLKTNINFQGQTGADPLQSADLMALFYLISIMPQISTKDSGILY